jgi:hypothetical protein
VEIAAGGDCSGWRLQRVERPSNRGLRRTMKLRSPPRIRCRPSAYQWPVQPPDCTPLDIFEYPFWNHGRRCTISDKFTALDVFDGTGVMFSSSPMTNHGCFGYFHGRRPWVNRLTKYEIRPLRCFVRDGCSGCRLSKQEHPCTLQAYTGKQKSHGTT